jgi:hypothetical protein
MKPILGFFILQEAARAAVYVDAAGRLFMTDPRDGRHWLG